MMGPGFGGCCGFGSYGTFGWIGMMLNFLLIAAVFGGIIGLAVWAVRRANAGGSGANRLDAGESPREILQAHGDRSVFCQAPLQHSGGGKNLAGLKEYE